MLRQLAIILGMGMALSGAPAASFAQSIAQKANVSDEEAIRENRHILNNALRTRDVKAIADLWLDDIHGVGYSGKLAEGRKQSIAKYADYFSGSTFISGVRNPERIEVATGGPLEAAETGAFEWQVRQSGEPIVSRGRYLVMWKKVDGHWKIQSELYVRTSCSGKTC